MSGCVSSYQVLLLTSPPLVDHDGEVIGTHQWEEEVLKETGGEYLYVKVSKNKKTSLDS